MANKIIIKKSSIAGKIPLTTDLEYGELAINYTDGKLYYKNANNVVGLIGGSGGGGNILRIYQRGDVLQEDAVIVTATSGTLTVGVRPSTSPLGSVGVSI